MKKETNAIAIYFIITFLTLSFCSILFDLYEPIKQTIFGNYEWNKKVLSLIDFKKHLPVIIPVSVASTYGNIIRIRKAKLSAK